MKPKDVLDSESVRKATGVGDVSEILRKGKEQDEMEVQLAAEAIETVFNDATTMEDLDKGETKTVGALHTSTGVNGFFFGGGGDEWKRGLTL